MFVFKNMYKCIYNLDLRKIANDFRHRNNEYENYFIVLNNFL